MTPDGSVDVPVYFRRNSLVVRANVMSVQELSKAVARSVQVDVGFNTISMEPKRGRWNFLGRTSSAQPDGRDVYGLQILDATLETGNSAEVEEDTAASALLLKHEFLDGGPDDVTLATLGEVLLERSPR